MNPQDEPPVTDASVLEKVRVPLAGDLLGRERVTGAKKTRLGCDSAAERFENIVECPALWHAKQSFLSVGWKFQLNVTWFYYFLLVSTSEWRKSQSSRINEICGQIMKRYSLIRFTIL